MSDDDSDGNGENEAGRERPNVEAQIAENSKSDGGEEKSSGKSDN